MTQVFLVPWLLLMSGTIWVGEWMFGFSTDHPVFLLWLAGGFAICDWIRFFWLHVMK